MFKSLIVMLLLAACAAPAAQAPVHMGPALTTTIPPYAYHEPAREVDQLVVARYRDQTYSFQAHLSMNAERLLLVGLDPLGRKSLAITWTPDGVTYEKQPWLPADLHPENILADIILIYWPERVVVPWLNAAGAQLHSTATTRRITSGSDELITITYPQATANRWNSRAHYAHRVWGYTLDIQSTGTRP